MLAVQPLPAMDTRRVTTLDGVSIAYQVAGAAGAPWVVLANGLGGSSAAWRGPIDYLGDRYRLLTWDYRGLYGSSRPSPDVDAAYGVDKHASDLDAVLAAEGIERASLVGWSFGAQVILESVRRAPARVASLVLVNGTYGRPIDTLTPIPGAAVVIPSMIELLRRAHALATQVARRTIDKPEALRWLKRLGIVGETFDEAMFGELARAFATLDLEPFFRIVKAAGHHDAEPVLSSIAAPVLIIAGDHDPFTPRELAHQMARRIPESETLIVPGGTHYVPVEYPELVSLRIERFFRAHGY
jgi:pimeloyl-ACP methyl ester carboxylesterase